MPIVPPHRIFLLLLATLLGCGSSPPPGQSGAPRPGPNFVVIFLDDVGYGDIQPFGRKDVETPQLNRMAEEGMRLTSFYAAPVCTPSRAALLTGCYPKRVGLDRGFWHGVLQPGDEKGLNPDEVTIAELLREQGYGTGVIGKWHLGDQPEFLPSKQGFDYWFGLPYSNDMIPDNPRAGQRNFPPLALMRNDEVIETVTDQTTLTRRYTEEAVRFIEENRDHPFFLYVPHTMAHVPLYAGESFKERSDIGVLGDVLMELDWSVGRILDALRVNSLERSTMVIFTSDNGPARGTAGPLRGRKGSTFEGGMREPTIAWWPGTIPPQTASDEVTSTMGPAADVCGAGRGAVALRPDSGWARYCADPARRDWGNVAARGVLLLLRAQPARCAQRRVEATRHRRALQPRRRHRRNQGPVRAACRDRGAAHGLSRPGSRGSWRRRRASRRERARGRFRREPEIPHSPAWQGRRRGPRTRVPRPHYARPKHRAPAELVAATEPSRSAPHRARPTRPACRLQFARRESWPLSALR